LAGHRQRHVLLIEGLPALRFRKLIGSDPEFRDPTTKLLHDGDRKGDQPGE
jgi:hypothetical protein